MAAWAMAQGCDVTLLVNDDQQEVYSGQIFKAIQAVVEAGTYEQLLIYFSGHGILLAPGTEYWLLSGAPQNANEAVNLVSSWSKCCWTACRRAPLSPRAA